MPCQQSSTVPAQSQSVMFASLARLVGHKRDLVSGHLTPLGTAIKCSTSRLLMCNWEQASLTDMLLVTKLSSWPQDDT